MDITSLFFQCAKKARSDGYTFTICMTHLTGATGTEIQYVDDNDNWIKPYKEGDSELDGAIYSITFHSGSSGADLDVFTYLYLEDK